MINLHFRAAPYFLAYYPLTVTKVSYFKNGKVDPNILAYQKQAQALDNNAYRFATDDNEIHSFFRETAFKDNALSKASLDLDKLLENLQKESSFKAMLDETSKALVKIRHDWEDSLPKMQSFADHLCDQSATPDNINVFVTQQSLNMSGSFFGDIYMTDFSDHGQNGNSLYLWSSVVEQINKVPDLKKQNDGNHNWVSSLITELYKEEIYSRLKDGESKPDREDKIFLRDLALLKPVFVEFLNQPGHKTIAEFHDQAYEFMMTKWQSLKK